MLAFWAVFAVAGVELPDAIDPVILARFMIVPPPELTLLGGVCVRNFGTSEPCPHCRSESAELFEGGKGQRAYGDFNNDANRGSGGVFFSPGTDSTAVKLLRSELIASSSLDMLLAPLI